MLNPVFVFIHLVLGAWAYDLEKLRLFKIGQYLESDLMNYSFPYLLHPYAQSLYL